jgi:cell shape-determining protein MreC
MRYECRILVGLTVGLVFVSALTAGCQQQQEAARETQAGLVAAANAKLNEARAGHKAEIEGLQRQYGEVLRRRENGLAKRQREIETLRAENTRLREKIRMVKTELAKLEEMIGTEIEPPENGG